GADELTQTTFVELTHPEDWRNNCGRVDQLLAGEVDTIDLEHRYCRTDESSVWVHATLSLVRQEDGAPDYIIMVVHDISDRKQAEAERLLAQEASRRTTSRLQTLIQNLQAGVLLVDDQERVVFTNQIFQQLFQLNLHPQIQQQVAYKSVVRAVAQRVDQAERFVTSQHHTLRDRQLMAQRPWQLTNGRTVEEDFIPIWMGEEYGGHLWLFRDITDRRRSDLALQQQYQQLLLLRRLTHEVRQTLDPQLMFQTAVDSIGSALKCDRCHLYLYPGTRDTLPCAAEYLAPGQSSLNRMMLPVRNNCFAQVVLAEDAAIASSNITRDPLLKDMVSLCQEGNISALVAVRTSYQNRPNGLLVIHQCGKQRQWTDGDLEILEAVAGQVGIALAQVKLLTQEKEQRQQLALQNQELEAARKTAESASHAKGDFLATMSHEIRTPLNAVIGMSGLLMETSLTGQQAEWLEVLRNSSETLLALINDVLDYSKIESGQLELEERPVEVSQCVQESLTLVEAIAQRKDLSITHTIADNVPPVVMGDGTRLRQVLVNLLSNAVKFTDEGAITVTVTAREVPTPASAPPAIAQPDAQPDAQSSAQPNAQSSAQPDAQPAGPNGDRPPTTLPLYELQFDVQDTGIGISAEQQTQLFKSFSQVDASITRRYGGTGLGLAICLRLTRLMQGQLWVDSELGQGSTFHFTAVMPQGASAVMPSSLLGELEQTALSGKQLWVIDDNPVNRQFLVHNSEQWGITVTTFGRAEDALGCLEQDQPTVDAMVVDWRLPGMNGIEFATALEQHPPYDQVPLVMLTAAQMPPVEPPVVHRFTAWLQNPIPRETLHEVLTQVLAPPDPAEGPAAIAAKLTDPDSPGINGVSGVSGVNGAENTEGAERSPQENSPNASEVGQTTAPTDAAATVNPLRILLAEDNPVNQKVALLMLERLGYQADVVGDGEEVLEALGQTSYSLILMDLEMPHMDGLTAAKEIQKRYDLADRPQIVALTAYAMDEDRDR
ncbi:MAG: response regulator, partial [Cyanobacteria bacterium P01_H01_bin.130]